jgi:hypothetical protein
LRIGLGERDEALRMLGLPDGQLDPRVGGVRGGLREGRSRVRRLGSRLAYRRARLGERESYPLVGRNRLTSPSIWVVGLALELRLRSERHGDGREGLDGPRAWLTSLACPRVEPPGWVSHRPPLLGHRWIPVPHRRRSEPHRPCPVEDRTPSVTRRRASVSNRTRSVSLRQASVSLPSSSVSRRRWLLPPPRVSVAHRLRSVTHRPMLQGPPRASVLHRSYSVARRRGRVPLRTPRETHRLQGVSRLRVAVGDDQGLTAAGGCA